MKLIECKTRKTAINRASWAAKIVKVDGGWMAFETITEFNTWKNQK